MSWLYLAVLLLIAALLWSQTIALAQLNARQERTLVTAQLQKPVSVPYEGTEILTQLRLIESSASHLAGAIKSETGYAVADALKQLQLIESNTSRLVSAMIDLESSVSALDIRLR
jgi:hypothetical protein